MCGQLNPTLLPIDVDSRIAQPQPIVRRVATQPEPKLMKLEINSEKNNMSSKGEYIINQSNNINFVIVSITEVWHVIGYSVNR